MGRNQWKVKIEPELQLGEVRGKRLRDVGHVAFFLQEEEETSTSTSPSGTASGASLKVPSEMLVVEKTWVVVEADVRGRAQWAQWAPGGVHAPPSRSLGSYSPGTHGPGIQVEWHGTVNGLSK
jgi:hypothetical protein